jgi:hypothetical protein
MKKYLESAKRYYDELNETFKELKQVPEKN